MLKKLLRVCCHGDQRRCAGNSRYRYFLFDSVRPFSLNPSEGGPNPDPNHDRPKKDVENKENLSEPKPSFQELHLRDKRLHVETSSMGYRYLVTYPKIIFECLAQQKTPQRLLYERFCRSRENVAYPEATHCLPRSNKLALSLLADMSNPLVESYDFDLYDFSEGVKIAVSEVLNTSLSAKDALVVLDNNDPVFRDSVFPGTMDWLRRINKNMSKRWPAFFGKYRLVVDEVTVCNVKPLRADEHFHYYLNSIAEQMVEGLTANADVKLFAENFQRNSNWLHNRMPDTDQLMLDVNAKVKCKIVDAVTGDENIDKSGKLHVNIHPTILFTTHLRRDVDFDWKLSIETHKPGYWTMRRIVSTVSGSGL